MAQPRTTHPTVTTGPKPSTGGSTRPSRAPTSAASAFRPRTRSESHPSGLPARSSRRRMRTIRSSGVNLRPIEVNHSVSGSSTRSLKGRSRSRSRRSRRGRWSASTAASERATPLFGVVSANTPVAAIASTIARNTRTSPPASSPFTSHLDLDHASEPEGADAEQDQRRHEHHDPEQRRPQRPQVGRVRQREVDEEDHREAPEDPPREPALGREHLDLAAQPLALAQRVGDGHEELGEVAADVPLDADGHDHPREVLAGQPAPDAFQGVLDRHPEPALDQRPVELHRHRRLALADDGVQRLRQRVPGLQAAREHLEGVGELGEERALAPALPDGEEDPGRDEADDQSDDGGEQRAAAQGQERQPEPDGRAEVNEQPLRRPDRQCGSLEPAVDGLPEVPPLGHLLREPDGVVGDEAPAEHASLLDLPVEAGRPAGERVERQPPADPLLRPARPRDRPEHRGDEHGRAQEEREQGEDEHRLGHGLPAADGSGDGRCEGGCGGRRHSLRPTDCSKAKLYSSSRIPADSSFSRNRGPTPVGLSGPRVRSFSTMPMWWSKRKRSWRVMTSPSIPTTSVTWVMRRVPSLNRAWWTMRSTALATCSRIALIGSSTPAMRTMVSTRESTSRGPLACTVPTEPSWPVFMAWSMSRAAASRISPTTMRSGRMRSALRTRSRIRTSPLPSMFGGRASRRSTCS